MEETRVEFVARWSDMLNELRSIVEDPASTADVFANASKAARGLKLELDEEADRLPAFELKRCERELKSLQEQIAVLNGTSAQQKPSFSFKRSLANSDATSTVTPKAIAKQAAPVVRKAGPTIPSTSLAIKDQQGAYVSSKDLPSASESETLLLASLEKCFVDLTLSTPEISAIFLYSIKESIVIVPPIKGTIMLHDCHDCLLILGGHQFRMHDSDYSQMYLHVTSNPIIERSKTLLFGSYPFSSLGITSNNTNPSLFAEVQDFDNPFATAQNPSGNYRLASKEDEEKLWGDARWSSVESREKSWKDLLQFTKR